MGDKMRKTGKKIMTAVLLITVLTAVPALWAGAAEGENDNNNINIIMLYDSEGEVLNAGVAVALNIGDNSPAYIQSDIFDEEAAAAYLVTSNGSYEIEYCSSGSNISTWLTKDPCPADDPEFLKMADAHRGDRAIVCYYSKKSGELELYRETVILTGCDEHSWYTADHYPEAVIYPAVLVNANNECVGILEADGAISSMTDQAVFYENIGSLGLLYKLDRFTMPEQAIYLALLGNNDDSSVGAKIFNTSAVRVYGSTYVLTSADAIRDYNEDLQSLRFCSEGIPEGLKTSVGITPVCLTDEGEMDVYREKDPKVAVVIAGKQASGSVQGLPVASEINPNHHLGCIFSYVKGEKENGEVKLSKLTYKHNIMDYSFAYDNLYQINDEIGFEDSSLGGWSGALIYDLETREAVGIGTYVNGRYAFVDITSVMRKFVKFDQKAEKYFSVEAWGVLYNELHANDNN